MAYAETTSVPFEKSIAEIISHIKRHGAGQIGQMESDEAFHLMFKLSDRTIKFTLPFRRIEDMPTRDGRGSALSEAQRRAKLEQSKRQRIGEERWTQGEMMLGHRKASTSDLYALFDPANLGVALAATTAIIDEIEALAPGAFTGVAPELKVVSCA